MCRYLPPFPVFQKVKRKKYLRFVQTQNTSRKSKTEYFSTREKVEGLPPQSYFLFVVMRGTQIFRRLLPTAPLLSWGGTGGWGDDAEAGWGKSTGSNPTSGNTGGGFGGSTTTPSTGWGSTSPPSSGGGWGGQQSSPPSRGGGFGGDNAGGGGGWQDRGGRGGPKPWSGGDQGWNSAPTGSSRPMRSMRGRGRGGFGSSRSESQGGWGKPPPQEDQAWGAAPPSFEPPVRRVDPLTLTAVEVDIDGVKKLVGQRIIVSGVSDDTSWQTLKDHLKQVGEIGFCRVLPGGRAIAEFITPEEASKAISELQGSELEGATLFMREDRDCPVLIHTRKKIREAREAQMRAKKAEENANEATNAAREVSAAEKIASFASENQETATP